MPRKKKRDFSAIPILAIGVFLILFSISFFHNCNGPSFDVETKAAHVTGYSCTIFLSDIMILIFIGILFIAVSMGMQARKGFYRKQ